MTTTPALEIPADLDRWHSYDVTEWLNGVEYDVNVSDADVDRARRAAAHALDVDLDAQEAGA